MGLGKAAICLGVALLATTGAFAQEMAAKLTAEQIEASWADLAGDEPNAARALLVLSQHREQTTEFLATKLKPLALTADRLDGLLVQLGSENPEEWQAAFRELEYFDPRLATGLEEIMDLGLAQKAMVRNRLVAILSGRSYKQVIEYKHLTLEPVGKDGFNFRGSMDDDVTRSGSWWAEHKVERLNNGSPTSKKLWTRAARALALLESFDTEQSLAVIKTMCTGHPDAQPTRVAKQMIEHRAKQQ